MIVAEEARFALELLLQQGVSAPVSASHVQLMFDNKEVFLRYRMAFASDWEERKHALGEKLSEIPSLGQVFRKYTVGR